MKKNLFAITLLFLALLGAGGQNAKIVGEVCPGCGVYVKGRHLEPSDHKAGCWWLAQQQSAQQQSSSQTSSSGQAAPAGPKDPYAESGAFENVEGKPLTNEEYDELLRRTRCDYCGGSGSKHSGDCIVGRTYRWWQEALDAGQQWKARTMRDNIVTLILATESGRNKLHQMRGTAEPQAAPAPSPSTKLKDYTPMPERPAANVSAPMMDCPLAQPAPQFSGINEQSVVHEKMQNTAGTHEWGEMADRPQYKQYPIEYDIERWTHTEGGPVILGKRNPDGTTRWYVLHRDREGKYVSDTKSGYVKTKGGKELALKDVRFEGEGQYIVEEYEGGYKIYVDPTSGYWVAYGYEAGIAPMKVNGHYFVMDRSKSSSDGRVRKCLHAGPQKSLLGEDIVMFDDAIVVRNSYGERLLNWDWTELTLDGKSSFKEIRCMSGDRGTYYVIEVSEGKFALVARGFRQVGGLYGSAGEALAAWRNQ